VKLIVGLGNPGKKFTKTRHNVGHMFVAKSEKLRTKSGGRAKFVKTSVFMNDSGNEILSLITNYELPITDLLIVHDDMDLPLGKFKLQRGRGAAGHKGVQSIIDALGTRDFWRLRIGIGRPAVPALSALSTSSVGKVGKVGKEGYVLGEFNQDELKCLQKVFEEVYPRVLEWVNRGAPKVSEG